MTTVTENGEYRVYTRPAWMRLNMFHDGPTEYKSNQAFTNQ